MQGPQGDGDGTKSIGRTALFLPGKNVKLFPHGTKVFPRISSHLYVNLPQDIWQVIYLNLVS